MFTPTTRILSAAAISAALAVPSTASAMLIGGGGPQQTKSTQRPAQVRSSQQASTKPSRPHSGGLANPTARVRTGATNSAHSTALPSQAGFHWDDAGLGAGGILALLGLGAGSVTVITRRRTQQTPLS